MSHVLLLADYAYFYYYWCRLLDGLDVWKKKDITSER